MLPKWAEGQLKADPADFSPPLLRIQEKPPAPLGAGRRLLAALLALEGKVRQVSADATEAPSPNTRSDALSGRDRPMGPLAYRALVELNGRELVDVLTDANFGTQAQTLRPLATLQDGFVPLYY